MQSDLAQYGPNDVGGDEADQENRDDMPEQDEPRGHDGGIQEHLRGDQRLTVLKVPRAPNILVLLQSCLSDKMSTSPIRIQQQSRLQLVSSICGGFSHLSLSVKRGAVREIEPKTSESDLNVSFHPI